MYACKGTTRQLKKVYKKILNRISEHYTEYRKNVENDLRKPKETQALAAYMHQNSNRKHNDACIYMSFVT